MSFRFQSRKYYIRKSTALSDWIILSVSGVGCSEALITAVTANAITGAVQAGVSIVVALVVSPKRLGEIFSSLSENKGEGNDI